MHLSTTRDPPPTTKFQCREGKRFHRDGSVEIYMETKVTFVGRPAMMMINRMFRQMASLTDSDDDSQYALEYPEYDYN